MTLVHAFLGKPRMKPAMASAFTGYLHRTRQRTLDRVSSAGAFSNIYFSGTTYSLWRAAEALTAHYSRGLVLDAGSGRGAWKHVIERSGKREAVDISPKAGEDVTWIADITNMPEVPTARYDASVCHQVLEHVPDPSAAAAELFRVIKPGGHLVVSVPHLSRLHELPHDYFRFTPNGLERLLRDAGFEVISIAPFGGILSFLHHQFATLFLGIASVFRPFYLLCVALNAPFSWLVTAIDGVTDESGMLAVGVIGVVRKPLHDLSDADGTAR